MKAKEIKDIISELDQSVFELNQKYEESEGEVTLEAEKMEADIENLRSILEQQALDDLAHKLVYFDQTIETIKAEASYLSSQAKGLERAKDYVKWLTAQAMDRLGIEKVKSDHGYSFTRYTAVKTKANDEAIKVAYLAQAEKALRDAGIPEYITVKLSASASLVPEGQDLPGCFTVEKSETCKFLKPRKTQ